VKFFVKLLLKAGIALGVMFIGYKYILTGDMGGFQIPGTEGVGKQTQKGITRIENAVVDKDVTVYQWVDDKGTTHYGSAPPTGQGHYTKKEIHTDTNLLNAFQAPEPEEKPTQKSRSSQVGSVYSPEAVEKLMDDAKGIEDLLEERTKEQNKILENL